MGVFVQSTLQNTQQVLYKFEFHFFHSSQLNTDTHRDQKQAPSSFEERLVSIRRQERCKIELLILCEIKDAFPVHTHMTHP